MVINAEEKGKVDKGSGNGGGSGKAHNIFISSDWLLYNARFGVRHDVNSFALSLLLLLPTVRASANQRIKAN